LKTFINDDKKIFAFGIILFIIIIFTACKGEVVNINNVASLEDIKNTLANAGYIIVEDYEKLYGIDENLESSVGGFPFVFPRVHGNLYTFVFEFKNNVSVEFYAEFINIGGHYLFSLTII